MIYYYRSLKKLRLYNPTKNNKSNTIASKMQTSKAYKYLLDNKITLF
jgi:hypothetical protein